MTPTHTTAVRFGVLGGLLLSAATVSAQPLVSHWTFNDPGVLPNSSPWANSVAGGPDMVWDASTNAPGTFDPEQVRMETFPDPNTRLSADDASLDVASFSFSLVIDPTDMGTFVSILQKESGAPSSFADFQRVAWQVSHTEFGNVEFVVRGVDPGTLDFFGSITVLADDSGFPEGTSFDDDSLWHICGGYDAATGDAAFYVTPLAGGQVCDLVGSTDSFVPGATQDSSPLSVGQARSNGDFVGIGAGFDVDDLQIYDRLLSPMEFLMLAQNPGEPLPDDPQSPLDFAPPFGILDMFDIAEYLNQFEAATAP